MNLLHISKIKLSWSTSLNGMLSWREMQLLMDNKTWELIELSSHQALIDSKWMYKLKYNPARDNQ